MTIVVIDYGIGNVRSVVNACERMGQNVLRVTSGEELLASTPDAIILPGVGAIGAALGRLRERDLETALNTLVLEQKVPILGICVGMQMLATTCEEFGTHRALGWIPGHVARLGLDQPALRVPHIGWNSLEVNDPHDAVFGMLDGRDMYFVHSYAMMCDKEYVAATVTYGHSVVAAVRRGHICGVQFHPEKSSHAGALLIENFVKSIPCSSVD